MLSLQPENSRLDGWRRTLHGSVMGVLSPLFELGGVNLGGQDDQKRRNLAAREAPD
jgi:hypothetical protein